MVAAITRTKVQGKGSPGELFEDSRAEAAIEITTVAANIAGTAMVTVDIADVSGMTTSKVSLP
jgi:hypothetical protein